MQAVTGMWLTAAPGVRDSLAWCAGTGWPRRRRAGAARGQAHACAQSRVLAAAAWLQRSELCAGSEQASAAQLLRKVAASPSHRVVPAVVGEAPVRACPQPTPDGPMMGFVRSLLFPAPGEPERLLAGAAEAPAVLPPLAVCGVLQLTKEQRQLAREAGRRAPLTSLRCLQQ